jgi:hypothetical protein
VTIPTREVVAAGWEELVRGTTAAAAAAPALNPWRCPWLARAADVGVARAKRVRYSGASAAGK